MAETDNLLERIEWEGLEQEFEIKGSILVNGLPESVNLIKIWRGDNYKLHAKMSGTFTNPPNLSNLNGTPGDRITPFSVECTMNEIEQYKLSHCVIGNISYKIKHSESGNYLYPFDGELLTYQLEKRLNINSTISWVTEWYLNGPRGPFWYNRITERKFSSSYERKRMYDQITSPATFPGAGSESLTPDFIFVNCNDLKFTIHQVPNGLGPTWSKSIGIEYRKEFGEIPSIEQRIAISEIVSFIFGRRLLNIGYTAFNNNGIPLEQVAINPWGDNVVKVCSISEQPPTNSLKYESLPKIEPVFNELVPKYLVLRDTLSLNEVLWRYWLANTLPLGTNLPIYANGIEILANKWFKTTNSKTKGVYLPKKEFEKIMEKVLLDANQSLQGIEYRERIINRISNSYNMGANERMLTFFDEIGLKLGKAELEALRARNKMIHDSNGESNEEIDQMLYYTKVYKTFFNRVLLKILGHNGTYIDYSISGWPEKQVDQVVGLE